MQNYNQYETYRRKKKSNQIRTKTLFLIAVISFSVIALAGLLLIYFLIYYSASVPVTHEVSISCDDAIPHPSVWFSRLNGEAVIENTDVNTGVPGDYTVNIAVGNKRFELPLKVVDTEPPVANPVNVSAPIGASLEPEDFCKDLFDHSEITSEFVTPPDTSQIGTRNVEVKLTDAYGNSTNIKAVCEVFYITPEIVCVKEDGARTFTLEDFIEYEDFSKCRFVRLPREDFYLTTGEYEVVISVNGFECTSKITVVKTTPPAALPKNALIFLGERAESGDLFVLDENNIEPVTSEFAQEPNWEVTGNQNVTVTVTDVFGNAKSVTSVLSIVVDTVAPVITAKDFDATIGIPILYRTAVEVTDNYDPDPKLSIDSSKVDINKEGVYPVTYTATDRSGNASEVTVNVTVHLITQEILNEIADDRLNSLGVFDTDDPIERVKLIHAYVLKNVKYEAVPNSSYSNNELVVLYNSLSSMKGNCISHQRISEILLTRAGIENQRVINVQEKHKWNIIKIDGLWFYFDATAGYGDGLTDTYMFDRARAAKLSDTSARWQRYVIHEEDYPPIQ
ncbi:MAG: hypothetical protein FWF82_00375 [Oscillospiraceae bacterium]|nr:hypothetical protein [Oscillospiraceae bacterium]